MRLTTVPPRTPVEVTNITTKHMTYNGNAGAMRTSDYLLHINCHKLTATYETASMHVTDKKPSCR